MGRSGFTIVELLVVISVIAILMAVLLPVARYAREIARRTRCAQNLRQIHAAFLDYTDDYRGHTPNACVLNISASAKPSRPEYPEMLHMLLRPYVGGGESKTEGGMDVFHCPSDGPENYFHIRYGSSYQTRGNARYNNYPKPVTVPLLGQLLSDFLEPGNQGIVRDGRGWHRLSTKGGWSIRSTMGEQVLYLDGHIFYFGDVKGGAGGLP